MQKFLTKDADVPMKETIILLIKEKVTIMAIFQKNSSVRQEKKVNGIWDNWEKDCNIKGYIITEKKLK